MGIQNPFRYIGNRAEDEGVSLARIDKREELIKIGVLFSIDYVLSTGETIQGAQDKEGTISIVCHRGEQELFNFQEFIPEGVRLVSGKTNQYDSEKKIISLTPQTDAKDIIVVLHEIGHAILQHRDKDIWEDFRKKYGQYHKRFVAYNSWAERTAWAEAIKLCRKIKEKYGVNLLEPFKNLRELQDRVYTPLSTHRYANEPFLDISVFIKHAFGGELSEDDRKFIENLFDKKKFIE